MSRRYRDPPRHAVCSVRPRRQASRCLQCSNWRNPIRPCIAYSQPHSDRHDTEIDRGPAESHRIGALERWGRPLRAVLVADDVNCLVSPCRRRLVV